jgi:hypothetical protein
MDSAPVEAMALLACWGAIGALVELWAQYGGAW